MTPLRSALLIAISALVCGLAGLMFGYLMSGICPNFVESAFRRPQTVWTPWETAGGYGAAYGTILGIFSGWVIVLADALRNGRGVGVEDLDLP